MRATSSTFFFFFFNDPAPTEIYPLPLHDALPIFVRRGRADVECHTGRRAQSGGRRRERVARPGLVEAQVPERRHARHGGHGLGPGRSEEHTSELQSRSDIVCRLLLEKKKNKTR